MSNGANIPIAADATGVIKGTKDTEQALEKVIDTLDDVDRAGSDTSKGLDNSLDKVERAADQSADKLERSFREAFDAVKKDSARATDDVARTTKVDMDRAAEGTADLKNNAASNAKEFAASWDGSIEGLLQSVQGFGAEALEGFGALGLAGGVALAAIGGALLTSITNATEASKQRVSDMFDQMRESKQAFLTQDAIDDELAKIAKGADDAVISWAKVEEAAKLAGVTSGTVARAYAGDQEAAQRYTDAVAAKLQKIADNHSEITNEMDLERNALWDLQDQWSKRSGEFDKASQAYKQYAAAAEESEDRAREAVEATREGVRGLRSDAQAPVSLTVTAQLDTSAAEKTLRNWRPEVTVMARVGKPAVT